MIRSGRIGSASHRVAAEALSFAMLSDLSVEVWHFDFASLKMTAEPRRAKQADGTRLVEFEEAHGETTASTKEEHQGRLATQ